MLYYIHETKNEAERLVMKVIILKFLNNQFIGIMNMEMNYIHIIKYILLLTRAKCCLNLPWSCCFSGCQIHLGMLNCCQSSKFQWPRCSCLRKMSCQRCCIFLKNSCLPCSCCCFKRYSCKCKKVNLCSCCAKTYCNSCHLCCYC